MPSLSNPSSNSTDNSANFNSSSVYNSTDFNSTGNTDLKGALSRILAVEGVRTVAVIDIATGMIVRSAGAEDPGLAAAAADIAGEAKVARGLLGPRQPGGDLDEISTVTGDRLQVSRVLDSRLGEGFLLFVDLDRARANIALASLQVADAAPAVLA